MQGYYLDEWRCVLKHQVTFQLELEAEVRDVLTQVLQLQRQLALVGLGDQSQIQRVNIKSIEEGSVVVEGSVEGDDAIQQNQILVNLRSQLNGDGKLMGYHIITASYEKKSSGSGVDQDQHESEDKAKSTGSLLMPLALGIVGGLLLIAIVCVIKCEFSRSTEVASEEGPTQQNDNAG